MEVKVLTDVLPVWQRSARTSTNISWWNERNRLSDTKVSVLALLFSLSPIFSVNPQGITVPCNHTFLHIWPISYCCCFKSALQTYYCRAPTSPLPKWSTDCSVRFPLILSFFHQHLDSRWRLSHLLSTVHGPVYNENTSHWCSPKRLSVAISTDTFTLISLSKCNMSHLCTLFFRLVIAAISSTAAGLEITCRDVDDI